MFDDCDDMGGSHLTDDEGSMLWGRCANEILATLNGLLDEGGALGNSCISLGAMLGSYWDHQQ